MARQVKAYGAFFLRQFLSQIPRAGRQQFGRKAAGSLGIAVKVKQPALMGMGFLRGRIIHADINRGQERGAAQMQAVKSARVDQRFDCAFIDLAAV